MNERWKCGDDLPDQEGDPEGEPMGGKWGVPDDAQMQFLASQEGTADDFTPPAACTLPYVAEGKEEASDLFVPQVYPGNNITVGENPPDYPEEWSEDQGTYCPIIEKESIYVPQTLPENFCPVTEPECPAESPYAPESEDSSVPTVGFFRAPSTEIENAIIVDSEAKKYGFAQALGISLKSSIPYFIANTYGPIRRLWLDPNKIPEAIVGSADEAVWVKEYSIDIEGVSPLNPQKIPFFPLYQVTPRKRGKSTKRALSNLLNTVKYASGIVYIATDNTPEGEVQAWHIWSFVSQYEQQEKKHGVYTSKLRRLRYSEISEKALKAAMESAGGLDDALRAEGVARDVLKRLVTYSTGLVLRNLTSLGRILPQSTLDASTFQPTLNAIESSLLGVLAADTAKKFQMLPQLWGKVDIDLHLATNKNLAMQALEEGDVEKYRALDGEQVKLKVKKGTKKIEARLSPYPLNNGLDIGMNTNNLLGVPLSSYLFSLLSELFGYGAISIPNTLSRSMSKGVRAHIKGIAKKDGLVIPKNQKAKSNKANGLGGIAPVVDDLAKLVGQLPESARQLLFQNPQRYRALLDTFNIIKKIGESSILAPASLRPATISLKKNKLELEGEGRVVEKEGFLEAWKGSPWYAKTLENLGVEESLEGLEENSRALVKNVLARDWVDVGRPMGIVELMELMRSPEDDLGPPKDVYMAIESEALGARRVGLKNNQYFYDPNFSAHKRLPGGASAGITSLGLFMASLMGDLFPAQDSFPGLVSAEFAQRAERELRGVQDTKGARERQTRIQKLLGSYWTYLRPRLSYARKVVKEISQSYRRRGARVHWLDISRPPIAFPGAATDIPITVVEALNSVGDGEYQITDQGFLTRHNKDTNSVDMVWASPRKLYYRTYHFYEVDDVLAGIKYPAVWVMTYWTSFEIPDILETYARTRHIMVPESLSIPEVWSLFLNINWDTFDMMPSACFPAHKRQDMPEAIYKQFLK